MPFQRKELRCGSGKWHTHFATEARSDGTEWNDSRFYLATTWLVLTTEQCAAGAVGYW